MNTLAPATVATIDGNEAAVSVAYRLSEVIVIYPITPSTPMAEVSDEWSAAGKPNLWEGVPEVVEMQSEGGAAGALHGALQGGALATTFTASQGLLLMIPNMYKIAGELTPFCMHVTARALATHSLSIFGDHSDVMACRQTGFAMLASASVQEAQDLALVAHAATLESRVPFLHFFDGFRTSHEIAKIELLSDDVLRAMIDDSTIDAHRRRALSPDHPVIRGTAQNPDTYFQAREAVNGYYQELPERVQTIMDRFSELTGRQYRLFDYYGPADAERVVVCMASGSETAMETSAWLNEQGEKTGVVRVRLYRPFSAKHLIEALPPSVKAIAVLDRTKEPGSPGEPLYLDVATALRQHAGEHFNTDKVRLIGGRYGLGSKDFTPAMAKAVFDELKKDDPKNSFTVGIADDVTGTSLPYDRGFVVDRPEVRRAVFFGLGSDGTVGANKNSIKIIGEHTDNHAQAYFVYDSKKAGAITISHLRFGPDPIREPYQIEQAQFVACHQFDFLNKYDVLGYSAPGATVLLNVPGPVEGVWDKLPRNIRSQILEKGLKLHAIDAYRIAREQNMGGRINTIMQVCFFALSGILSPDKAIAKIKEAIEKTYGRKGRAIVERNFAVVDAARAELHPIPVPESLDGEEIERTPVPDEAPEFVKRVTSVLLAGKGDLLPVSAFPVDGTWPTGTAKWEKRNLAPSIPVWDADICIQCNKCVMACPHAAIRAKFYEPSLAESAPSTFKSTPFRSREFPGMSYTLQVAPEDCTGCELCVHVCPAKDKATPKHKAINMEPQSPLRDAERDNYRFFLDLPSPDRTTLKQDVKHIQFLEPLFEYSGACAGCGETPYVKLLTQLFGDRLLIANATGCSSIYGGNLPTTPYTVNADGRGPAWANSLFEDNAEFGLGLRLAMDRMAYLAQHALRKLAPQVGDSLVEEILSAQQSDETMIASQRQRVVALREKLKGVSGNADARALEFLADYLVRKSVWSVGGDGWAYDIGYGGLDHVLASGRDLNLLVLDTEVYSNTGGQCSKSTPMSASAKFSSEGKALPKKDLGLMALTYGSVYVASVAMGAKDAQTTRAFLEAESYPGPSLILAYSHCIAHGITMNQGMDEQKLAVDSGSWKLFRFDPRRIDQDAPPLQLDSPAPRLPLSDFLTHQLRFRALERSNPERAQQLRQKAQEFVSADRALFEKLAEFPFKAGNGNGEKQE